MAITYNGTKIDKIVYNGTEVFGGNSVQETSLWTNSRPSSQMGYQTLYNIPYTNYDYIKVKYRRSTSEYDSATAIFKVSDCSVGYRRMAMCIGIGYNNESYIRPMYLINDNQVLLISGIDIANGSNKDSYCIPTEIIGIKGKIGE